MYNFALVGASGFIAPRHLKAIKDTGNRLVAASDPHDSVGILDRFFPDARFFTEFERFDRHLEKLRLSDDERKVDYLSVCSPNYLHDAHARLGLRLGAKVICEKPLVLNPWNLDQLSRLEQDTGGKVFTVLQLRLLPALRALREELAASPAAGKRHVTLSYVTPRGSWYQTSWKGALDKSGGLGTNIGIHLFDLLLWLFGKEEGSTVHLNTPTRMAGTLVLEHAEIDWFLSVSERDIPEGYDRTGNKAFRSISVDGREIEFSEGFTDLHTRVYEDILAGRGFGIEEARPSIELVSRIRSSTVVAPGAGGHPFLKRPTAG